MKVFQESDRPDNLEFTNYERIDEELLFNQIMSKLNKNPNIVIGNKIVCPSEDLYHSSIDGEKFTLCYDIDYGSSIHCESKAAVEKLKIYFND